MATQIFSRIRSLFPLLSVRGLSVALLFLSQMMLARICSGPSEFGTYALWLTCLNILVIFIKFGTDTGAIRFLAEYKGNSKNQLINQYRLFSLNRILIVSFLFLMLALLYHSTGSPFDTPFDALLLFYMALAGFLLAHSQYRRGELLGVGQPIVSELSESILKPLLLLGCALLMLLNSAYIESEDLIRIHIVVLVVTSAISLLISRRVLTEISPKRIKKNELSTIKQDWRVSTKGMAVNVLIRQLIKSGDILLCATFLNTTQVAFYVVATRLADLVVFALTSANLIFAPKISLLFSQGNKPALNSLLKEASQTAFVIGGLLFLLLILGGQYILSLYGTEYVEGYYALIILSIGQLINSYFGPTGYLASMTGNQDQLTKALLASGAIAFVSYIIFIPLLGIEGAALSSMLGTISWNILIYLKMSRLEGLRSKAF